MPHVRLHQAIRLWASYRDRAAGGGAADWFARFRRWRPASIGSVAMGHEISVTSVQLAQAGAVIANGGFLVRPHLVLYEEAPGARSVKMASAQACSRARAESGHHHAADDGARGRDAGTGQVEGRTSPVTPLPGKPAQRRYSTPNITYTRTITMRRSWGSRLVVNPSMVVVVTVCGDNRRGRLWRRRLRRRRSRRLHGEALRLLGVPRDLPAELEEDQKTPAQEKNDKETGEDDFGHSRPERSAFMQDMQQALGDPSDDGAVPVVAVNAVSGPRKRQTSSAKR